MMNDKPSVLDNRHKCHWCGSSHLNELPESEWKTKAEVYCTDCRGSCFVHKDGRVTIV